MITVPELHAEYNKRIGLGNPKSTFCRLLKQHNWRKGMPDACHTKADPAVQDEFKKNA
ncbi:MAG: winged helix-turn-helix domain-containing protein [Deltaproteobacteria bacterium]|jgi:hypothetical protein|nr:winged helix-turn-helix domain-containing protein [Deltaproteobacteria bacterium]